MLRKTATLIGTVAALAAWTALPAYAAGTWALQAPVNPAGFTSALLASVWCASASDCIAVGDYQNSSDAYGALAEQWNGSKWSLQSPYSPTDGQLYGISCVSASSCEAVGSDSAGELAEDWNGSFWADQVLSGGRGLLAVSCVTASDCEAVGYDSAELWNGIAWTAQTLPSGTTPTLNSVSCTAASNCVAVGYITLQNGATAQPESEHWNGSTWSAQSMPNLGNVTEADGVSCPSATDCIAVGGHVTVRGVQSPTADSWNGSTWTALSPVNQGSTTLNEISCTSTTNCIAVGAYGPRGSVSAAAESWNGSTWTAQTVPDPAGSGYTVLYGVSCPSATDCSAVGWWESSSSSFPTVADQYTS
jgi:hypothetical protein